MIREISIDDPRAWDETVRSFPDYDVFYLSGYSGTFMRETPRNGRPVLLYYEDGEDRAINVVLRRDVALDEKLSGKVGRGRYFDLVTPYGYGGFWGNISDWDRLNSEYERYCRENRYVCEFVRFELFTDYHAHYDGEVETRTHNVVRSLDMPLDEMWMDFKQKVRKNVKRANTYGLACIIENTGERLDDFLRIYYGTMRRTEAEDEYFFSRRFFEDLITMKDNVMFFHAVHEGKVISTELVIYGAENCYSYLGGTDSEYFDMRPNDYLKYEIIKWAKEKGLKNFVLGGGYGTDDGIFRYKLCLAPHGQRKFYIGRRIFDREAYDGLVALRAGAELNERYFPLYRS
ncbi:MAG: GNAT family N-acetyltransferase [Clostridiales bacterium]|nr:GNAT family N-acetyltransferase [Clostridiales bacterium]